MLFGKTKKLIENIIKIKNHINIIMEYTNLNKVLQRWSGEILNSYVEKIKTNTSNKNHNYSKWPKRLAHSALFKVKILENFIGIYFEANKYWIFVEKGVKRRRTVDVNRKETRLSDSQWQLKPRPFLNSSIKEDIEDIKSQILKAYIKDIKNATKQQINSAR